MRKKEESDQLQRHLDGLSEAEVIESLKKVKDKVEWVCKKHPCATGNYNLLSAYFFHEFYGRKFGMPFEELLRVPSNESVSRAFRLLVKQGKIKPSGKILERRSHRQQIIRENIHEV